MKVVIKEPGRQAYVKEIENKLNVYQEIVGGYIEVLPLIKSLRIICNEEGKIKDLDPNIFLDNDIIMGSIVVTAFDGIDDFRDLTSYELNLAFAILAIHAI